MSALPSGTSSLLPLAGQTKENRPSTVTQGSPSRRKRAQSLGGDALDAANKMAKLGASNIFGQPRGKLVSGRARGFCGVLFG